MYYRLSITSLSILVNGTSIVDKKFHAGKGQSNETEPRADHYVASVNRPSVVSPDSGFPSRTGGELGRRSWKPRGDPHPSRNSVRNGAARRSAIGLCHHAAWRHLRSGYAGPSPDGGGTQCEGQSVFLPVDAARTWRYWNVLCYSRGACPVELQAGRMKRRESIRLSLHFHPGTRAACGGIPEQRDRFTLNSTIQASL